MTRCLKYSYDSGCGKPRSVECSTCAHRKTEDIKGVQLTVGCTLPQEPKKEENKS